MSIDISNRKNVHGLLKIKKIPSMIMTSLTMKKIKRHQINVNEIQVRLELDLLIVKLVLVLFQVYQERRED